MKVLKSDDIVIRGIKYKIRLLNDKDFEILHGNQTDAIMLGESYIIDFKASELSIRTVMHEVFHAYFNSSLTETAELSSIQTEECLAEMFANFGTEMVEVSNKIFKKFSKGE